MSRRGCVLCALDLKVWAAVGAGLLLALGLPLMLWAAPATSASSVPTPASSSAPGTSVARPSASAFASRPSASAPAAAAATAAPSGSAPRVPVVLAPKTAASWSWMDLHLRDHPVALPAGQLGKPYKPVRIVLEGTPPYSIWLEGTAPKGLKLGDEGALSGTPAQAGPHRFTVYTRDSTEQTASRTYTLFVVDPARRAASKPSRVTELSAGDIETPPSPSGTRASYWQLTAEQLADLLPLQAAEAPQEGAGDAQSVPALGSVSVQRAAGTSPAPAGRSSAPAPAPAPSPAEAARNAQLTQALQALAGQEFPTQSLLEAALDAAVCAHARDMLASIERGRGVPPSNGAALHCATAWESAARAGASAAAANTVVGGVLPAKLPVRNLPAWLMPRDLRDALAAAAHKTVPLDPAPPLSWLDSGCGCVHADLVGQVQAFYPFWSAKGQAQTYDFSLLNRVGFHSATFGDDGTLLTPVNWPAGHSAAGGKAQMHGTRLDLILWRNDWGTLVSMDDEGIARAARELVRGAIALIDTRLPAHADPMGRVLALMGRDWRTADGITLFFDAPLALLERPEQARAFDRFVRLAIHELITRMHGTPQLQYQLSIAIAPQLLGRAPFDFGSLFEALKRAEKPEEENQRIKETRNQLVSRTNVTMRFVALLPEPTTDSKKWLRRAVEATPGVYGNDRRVLLRRIVPAIGFDGVHRQQLEDDLAYFRDNFGGVGLWPMPQAGTPGGDLVNAALKATFLAKGATEPGAVCTWVCTHRWHSRAALVLLALGAAAMILKILASGGLRCVSRTSLAVALALLLGTAAVAGLMIACDPDLTRIRRGNETLLVLLVLGFVVAAVALLRPRDVKP